MSIRRFLWVASRWLLVIGSFGFVANVSAQARNDCAGFYARQQFLTREVALRPVMAIRTPDVSSYVIVYQVGPQRLGIMRIYRNKAGEDLRAYLRPGDLIRKYKHEYSVTIARQAGDAMDVRVFDVGCR